MNVLDDLCSSEEYEQEHVGFCIPLKTSGFAWLYVFPDDVSIHKTDDGVWYNPIKLGHDRIEKLTSYLHEIQRGKGNWIISPDHDNSDLKWNELDYARSCVVRRISKITALYTYKKL
jgi:hypothetical protein